MNRFPRKFPLLHESQVTPMEKEKTINYFFFGIWELQLTFRFLQWLPKVFSHWLACGYSRVSLRARHETNWLGVNIVLSNQDLKLWALTLYRSNLRYSGNASSYSNLQYKLTQVYLVHHSYSLEATSTLRCPPLLQTSNQNSKPE